MRLASSATPSWVRYRARRWWAMVAALAMVSVMLGAPVSSAADPCAPGSNKIVCENSKPGTNPSDWDINGYGSDSIQGFATDISVNVGKKIDFKIDTDATNYTIDIYRTGWYQGLGARKIATVAPIVPLPQVQPECRNDIATELVDCGNWSVSASWTVPADAVSGVYVANLYRADQNAASHITFIVRDESSQSQVLFQTSDPTWHAYNSYGGSSFYQGAANGRAYKLSYNRPFTTRGSNHQRDFYFANEYPTVRFLERNGYDVSYFSGIDTDRLGGLLTNHKVMLSVGHDEYWSGAQRTNIENARDAGVNLQFLTGNEGYWRTRYEPSVVDGKDYRTLVSYKETWSNAKIDPSPEWTGTSRDPRFANTSAGGGMPENNLTGTMYMVNDGDLPVTVSATEGKTRIWRNTAAASLAPGTSRALAPHTIGYESNEDIDNGFRPAGLIRLSTTTGPVPQYVQDYGNTVDAGETTHHVTLYKAPSGALVFSSGSIQWAWGLDQEHDGDGAAPDPIMQQAQVNLLADMGAQPASLMTGLTAATKSADTLAPTLSVSNRPPATPVNGTRYTVSGTAADASGVVAGVEYSVNGGVSWSPASGTSNWSFSYVQSGKGANSVLVRAIDDSGNYPATPTTLAVDVSGPYSVFGSTVPAHTAVQDPNPVELGLRFTPSSDGYITGVRFYKGATNTGPHTGTLWSPTGVKLATVEFADETASGWQSARFVSAVQVAAGSQYIISYSTNGNYPMDANYFGYRGITADPLTVAGGFAAAPAGVYDTNGQLPASSFQGGNYYVDAIYDTQDTSPLAAFNASPVDTARSVPVDAAVTVALSKPVTAASVKLSLKDTGGTVVPGTDSFDATTRIARFVPTSPLEQGTGYRATITATDALGNAVSTGSTWTFTTTEPDAVEDACPCSMFQDSTAPSIELADDSSALSLGMKFSPAAAGNIRGVKYYKAAGNNGPHTGKLFNAAGTLLASVQFADDAAAGWQYAEFSAPVPVAAGASYVVAYTSIGKYSLTPGALALQRNFGPLTTPGNAGLFTYSAGFPNTPTSSSYLVDVDFMPTVIPPIALLSKTPSAGAADFPTTTTVSMQFNQPVKTGFNVVLSSSGTVLSGTTKLSTNAKTLTFTPSAPMPDGVSVQVDLTGVKSAMGASLDDVSWTFRTEATDGSISTVFGNVVPETMDPHDTDSVSLGIKLKTSKTIDVTAIRYYRSSIGSGTHVGSLWAANGTRLAEATFTQESASGWQTAQLSTPVRLTAGTTFTVSYLAPQGGYAFTKSNLSDGLTRGPLSTVGANGLFGYGNGSSAPQDSWSGTNYYADVVFATVAGIDPTPDPTPPSGESMFGDVTPATVDSGDPDPIEVGFRFSSTTATQAKGLRFYKAPNNTGSHIGTLWDASGQVLGTVPFTDETASGWQSAYFATPIELPAGTYTVSYLAPNGHYSVEAGFFATPWSLGPFTATADNGRYAYGTGGTMPQNTFGNSNYFVDLLH